MHKEVNMLHGSITKGLMSMMIPIMIMTVMQNMFSIIDMTVLGNLVDDNAVGAVGACGMLITLCTSLLIGVSAGANVVVAKHLGAGERKKAEEAVGTGIAFALVGGAAVMIIGVAFARIFLEWTNCPPDLLNQATAYFRIYFIGAPAVMFYNFTASVLRAAGDTKSPMYFLILGGVVKICLNLFCVTVLKIDVEGTALGTVISNLIAGIFCFIKLMKMKDIFSVSFKMMKIHPAELKPMLYIGIPSGLQSAMYSLANVIIVATVNTFGKEATTGVSIANQFDGVMYQIIYAPSLALIPYLSQNIGAGNIERAKKSIIKATLLTIAFGATLGALSAVFSGGLSSIMSKNPEVIMYAKQKMMLISATYFICGINEIIGGALRGMGKPMLPTVATFIYMCVFRFIWVYGIFPYLPDSLTYLYLVWPVGWILSILTIVPACIATLKKLEKNSKEKKYELR